ncbi:hypothetical protein GQ42DRAFT_146569 [Ramicandelaber brevisporus]|nr:hypothetical protein GQ42DRAFT_146569 [Ramicandelaber brevisporus]
MSTKAATAATAETARSGPLPALASFQVPSTPPFVYYIPDVISPDLESLLTDQVYAASSKWVTLSNRRLQHWGGTPSALMVREDLPSFLTDHIGSKLEQLGIFRLSELPPVLNHVLVNEYHPGQGIMPHTDGPFYHDTVATVSLGEAVVLDLYREVDDVNQVEESDDKEKRKKKVRERVFSIVLEPRSLFVMTTDAYSYHLHGIDDTVTHDLSSKGLQSSQYPDGILQRTNTRISLTFRSVKKSIAKSIFPGLKR